MGELQYVKFKASIPLPKPMDKGIMDLVTLLNALHSLQFHIIITQVYVDRYINTH